MGPRYDIFGEYPDLLKDKASAHNQVEAEKELDEDRRNDNTDANPTDARLDAKFERRGSIVDKTDIIERL